MVTDDEDPRVCSWDELTVYEQHEAGFRGFKRGPSVRYRVKRRYNQEARELALVGWSAPWKDRTNG